MSYSLERLITDTQALVCPGGAQWSGMQLEGETTKISDNCSNKTASHSAIPITGKLSFTFIEKLPSDSIEMLIGFKPHKKGIRKY